MSSETHSFIFIKLATAKEDVFARVVITSSDLVTDVADRACKQYTHWQLNAAQLSLYLVAAGGDDEPAEEAVSAVLSSGRRLGIGWSLSRAGISSGAWLVARKITDSGAFSFFPFLRASPPVLLIHPPPPLAYPLPPHSQVYPFLVAVSLAAPRSTCPRLLLSWGSDSSAK